MSTRQNEMKKNIQKIGFIVGIAILLLLITPMEVNAALQANKDTHNKKTVTPTDWITQIREMEKGGGSMGLAETQNANLTPVGSNNIDVHMMRSTEFGAIAILSASGYGNPSNAKAITSTTGNNTGVMVAVGEWVAGGLENSIFSGVDARYFDTYTTSNTSARRGDALGDATTPNPGAAGWHEATNRNWVSSADPYFVRGNSSYGIFNFSRSSGSSNVHGRGVAVCGAGL